MLEPTEPIAAVVAWSTDQAGSLVGIPVSALDGVGVVGLVVLVGLGFATGRLYTRGQVVDLKDTHAREIDSLTKVHEREVSDIAHDRDEWRAAHRISETARVEEREHNAALVHDIAEPIKGLLGGVRQAATEIRSEVESQ